MVNDIANFGYRPHFAWNSLPCQTSTKRKKLKFAAILVDDKPSTGSIRKDASLAGHTAPCRLQTHRPPGKNIILFIYNRAGKEQSLQTPSRATDDVCTTTKIYSTKEDQKNNSPPAIFPRLLSMLFTARTTHAKPLKQHSKKKITTTQRQDTSTTKKTWTIMKFPHLITKSFLYPPWKFEHKKEKEKGQLPSIASITQTEFFLHKLPTHNGRGGGGGSSSANLLSEEPGKEKKKKTNKRTKSRKNKTQPQKTKRKTKSREMFYSPVMCEG